MATTPVIDVDALLVPIPGDHPSGKDLAYEPDYDAIREARRSEDDLPSGDWQREVKVADWDQVIALCSDCLGRKTKDLQIAAWLTEALARLFGFAGLRDGFRLLHGLQEHFWETCYPAIEDGDLESRIGPFLFLNDPRLLPLLIRNIPLTDGFGGERYSYLRYRESRETDNALRKNPDLEETLRAEGKITSKQFDDAVVQTPKAFYAQIVEDLRACLESFRAFERSTDEHFGAQAPSLLNIGQALHECQTLLEAILTEKRKTEPDPAPPL
ncbi:MAG: type VI secretion system protein TssA, partial [Isosphaeraceae bacterium]|nr:type VI secretion system protein TssA [Isosphaeraceae bacterium]